MGGEYLPHYSRRELEIVRIELDSTTYNAISLRARPVGSRIEYNLLYKYESELTLPQRTLAAAVLLAPADSLFGLYTTDRNRRSELGSVRFRALI